MTATLLRMRRVLALSFALTMLLAPAAIAQQPEPVIRPGVTVAGVDVGGQTLSQAAGTIEHAHKALNDRADRLAVAASHAAA